MAEESSVKNNPVFRSRTALKSATIEVLSDPAVKVSGMSIDSIARKIIGNDVIPFDMSEAKKCLSGLFQKELKSKDSLFAKVLNPKTRKPRPGWYRLKPKQVQPGMRKVNPLESAKEISTNYIGRGGEYAVMSELLFLGYNLSFMVVDEGVDIVANKDGVFSFVQVKTSYLDSKFKVSFKVPNKTYEMYRHNSNMRYVFVVKYLPPYPTISGNVLIFSLQNSELEREVYNGMIYRGDTDMNVKFRFDPMTMKPYLYNGDKEGDASYYMNKII